MSAAITERLVAVAHAACNAAHGERTAIYDTAARDLCMSRATLLKRLKEVTVTKPRKRRSDAGSTALTRDEAMRISAVLMESIRKNDKRLSSIESAVDMLRANGMIRAEFLDDVTGELRQLSLSTIGRALRAYGLHPDQLQQPAPVMELASLHPNHVWQIDASVCVLYYLKRSETRSDNGLRFMDAKEFYKNKPANLARIEQDRVTRYVITDHYSGAIYTEAVFGGESSQNIVSVLINAMCQREGDPWHGAPLNLMLDPGSANTSAALRNLCLAMQIELLINKPGQPRAKGQVENANNIVECSFEIGLRFIAPPESLEELNALAAKWRLWYNGTKIHGRHGHTRYGMWQTIRIEQLRVVPGADVLRELAVSTPESRDVSPKLRVSYKGKDYDVSTVPDVRVGDKLQVVTNPWREATVQIVLLGEDGHPIYHVCERVERNAGGFSMTAATIGREYKRHADTPAQRDLKDIERLVTGTEKLEDAAAARKGKAVPFGGQLDPYKHINETALPGYMPRRGTELNVPGRMDVQIRPLNHVQAANALRQMLPDWSAEKYQQMVRLYPDGVMETDLQQAAHALTEAPRLRAVGGI